MLNFIVLQLIKIYYRIEQRVKFNKLNKLIKEYLVNHQVSSICFDSIEIEIFTTQAVFVHRWDSRYRLWFLIEEIDVTNPPVTDYLKGCLSIPTEYGDETHE